MFGSGQFAVEYLVFISPFISNVSCKILYFFNFRYASGSSVKRRQGSGENHGTQTGADLFAGAELVDLSKPAAENAAEEDKDRLVHFKVDEEPEQKALMEKSTEEV